MAVSVAVPADDGAVKVTPYAELLLSVPPPLNVQVTPWNEGSFGDAAVNVLDVPASTCAEDGEIVSSILPPALVLPQPLAKKVISVATAMRAKIFFMTSSETVFWCDTRFIMGKESGGSRLI